MFGIPSGTIGILCIGFIGGYYFARFFDRTTSITSMQLGSLLTLLGIGPTALVFVQGYFQLSLLDPYGIGLMLGVLVNLILRYVQENATLKTLTPPPSAPSEAAGQPPQKPPRVSFLETVSATSSATASLQVDVAKTSERRYFLRIAQQAVVDWLKVRFPKSEILAQRGLLDFIVRTPDRRLGVEIIAAGQSRAVLNLLLRQFLQNTRKGIDEKEFEESWLIIVADNIGRAGELSGLLSEWKPGLPVSVFVGVLGDDGTFRPLDTTEK